MCGKGDPARSNISSSGIYISDKDIFETHSFFPFHTLTVTKPDVMYSLIWYWVLSPNKQYCLMLDCHSKKM